MFLLTSSDWTGEGWIDFPFNLILSLVQFIVYTYLFTLLYSFQNRWNKEILSGWLDILGKLEKTRAYFK